ncbi:MAG: hypothetical protein K2G45_08535 [Lachnospiraceae bacterium]|nr:hypothetical protein [Lachnospiraceae bacterium]
MRRIKKTILSLSLVAAMVMGEAGIALAAEPTATDIEPGYEITDPALNGATTASVDSLNVSVSEWSNNISISFSGNGSKFKVYVNDKLYTTYENTYSTANAENPAPAMYYASVTFDEAIKGGSYTIKVVPCSYSASGDVDGIPVSKTVVSSESKLSNLYVYTYQSTKDNGYSAPCGYVSWRVESGNSKVEIWRKEGKSAWKKIAETEDWSYRDYSVVPGKKYQYRIRTAANKNAYATVPAGKWLTSKATEKVTVSDVDVYLGYMDGVSIVLSKGYEGILSGYEIYRSTQKAKGYKKIATIADAEYTDNVKSGTYYYKVRGYYYDANTGKKYYGKLSEAKPIKLIMGYLDVTVKQVGKNAAKVEWNKVSGAQKYEVWYTSNASGDAWRLYKTTTGLSCKVTKLSNDTYYYFKVRAIKGTGSNTYITDYTKGCSIGFTSPSLYIAKRKATTTNATKKVTIKSTIKWDRIYGASKIRIIGVKDGKEKVLKTLKGTATSYTVATAITASNSGYDSIRVVAVKGKQQESSTINYGNHKLLDTVKKVTVKSSGTGAKITWNAVPGATSYTVYRVSPYEDKQYGGNYLASTDKNYYVDETIEPGVNYVYYVSAYNGDLNISSALYEQSRVTFNRKLSTTKITSIKNSAAKKATITWKSVASAPKYIVYRSTSKNGKYTKVGTTTKTTFTDSKLLKGKTYYYKIKTTGKNAAGFTLTSAFSGVKYVKITK